MQESNKAQHVGSHGSVLYTYWRGILCRSTTLPLVGEPFLTQTIPYRN